MFTVCSTEALLLLEQQLVCASLSLCLSEGGVYKRLTYGMIRRERDHRARLSKPIPAFLSSLSSAAIGHLACDFLFLLADVLQSTISCSLRAFCCLLCLCPFSLASMGTEVNHAQQDFWLCQSFLSATALMHVQQKCSPCAVVRFKPL